MSADLAQVLADFRGDAQVLRRRGQHAEAEMLETCAKQVQDAAEEYLLFLSESEAQLFSGEKVTWLKNRFPEWERRGHAFKKGRIRFYRQCVLPRRKHAAAAFEAGREAARSKTA